MLVLEGVVEVEQFRMVQLVHDADLTFDGVLVERIRSVDELGDEVSSGRFLDGPVHHAERSAACNNRLLKRPSMTECRARGLGLYRIADFTIQPNKNNSFYYSAEYE